MERVVVVALLVIGCGGRAEGIVRSDDANSSGGTSSSGTSSSGTSSSGTSSSGTSSSGTSSGGTSSSGTSSAGKPATLDVDARGFPILMPQSVVPSVQGDGRLPDLPEARVGEAPNGWDTCYGTPHLTAGAVPPCDSCPPARRGDNYLVAGLTDAPPDAGTGSKPQAYFYFDESSAAALWFDVFWISGSSEGTTVTLWPSNQQCEPLAAGATYDAERLLMTPGQWSTACVPLDSFGSMSALAFRWDTQGVLGVDALRFGPACP